MQKVFSRITDRGVYAAGASHKVFSVVLPKGLGREAGKAETWASQCEGQT